MYLFTRASVYTLKHSEFPSVQLATKRPQTVYYYLIQPVEDHQKGTSESSATYMSRDTPGEDLVPHQAMTGAACTVPHSFPDNLFTLIS